jgi:hypothetical protein
VTIGAGGFGFRLGLGRGVGGLTTLGPGSGVGLGVALTVDVSAGSPHVVGPDGAFIASPEYVMTQRYVPCTAR